MHCSLLSKAQFGKYYKIENTHKMKTLLIAAVLASVAVLCTSIPVLPSGKPAANAHHASQSAHQSGSHHSGAAHVSGSHHSGAAHASGAHAASAHHLDLDA